MDNDLVAFVDNQYTICVNIMRKKNADYAGQNEGRDPLANFRLAESLGVCKTDRAVLIRLLDKVARIATLLDKDPAVTGESFEDTIRDLANYAMILLFARGHSK